MRTYKSRSERSEPTNTSAPVMLQDEFWQTMADMEVGGDRSEALQILMKFIIKNKENKKLKKDILQCL